MPARCRANFCPWCGPLNASLVAAAIAEAGPERAIHLTLVGEDWQVRRARLRAFRYRVAKELGRIDWCYHVEPNPRGTGHHAHAYQRGDFLDQAALSRIADRCGMGRVVWVEKFERPRGSPGVSYGLKLAGIDYGLKLAEAGPMMEAYLAANGGRLVHASRGFFEGGLGAAMRRASEREGERGPETWVLERGEVAV